MKRYALDKKAAAMFPNSVGSWVKYADAMDAIAHARDKRPSREVAQYDKTRELPVHFVQLDALGEGVDIDRVHRRFAAVVA